MKLTGLVDLQNGLKERADLDLVKRAVKLNGSELQRTMKRNAVFVKGYSTGFTMRSISLGFPDSGLTAQVQPESDYASYVEYGTRKMEAQPFVRPSFYKQVEIFKKDLSRLMK